MLSVANPKVSEDLPEQVRVMREEREGREMTSAKSEM